MSAPRATAFSSFSSIRITAGGVDARPDLEDDVVDGDGVLVQSADLDDRHAALSTVRVLRRFQSVMGQNAVLAHQRHDVRGDAHDQLGRAVGPICPKRVVPLYSAVALHQLETYVRSPTSSLERIGAVGPVWDRGHGYRIRGYFLGREVMVADDEIHALCRRHRLPFPTALIPQSSAMMSDTPLRCGQVDPLDRDTVPFGVAVGDVEHQVGMARCRAQELVNQCYRRAFRPRRSRRKP